MATTNFATTRSPSNYNAAGQIAVSGGTSPYISEAKQNETATYDPIRQFLLNLIGNQAQSEGAYVPGFTRDRLASFTANPAVAPENFASLADPLRASLQPGFQAEQRQLNDILRKSGALQSGAAAFETRRLLENQGNRANQVIAANYVPLTDQLSRSTLGAINAGLQFPQANNNLLNIAGQVATGLRPDSTQIESIKGGTSAEAPAASTTPSNYVPFQWEQGTGSWLGR